MQINAIGSHYMSTEMAKMKKIYYVLEGVMAKLELS